MNYRALARKWRPQTFKSVVGQEVVLSALINNVNIGRLHHAYLFSGTRGIGKTTLARLLVKAFNCHYLEAGSPCGTCDNCQQIEQGAFIDLIEIDAASRTKVEDTRELLSNVQYVPTCGKYKIYLIDEVHMLSRHSFNALLKTLEEPPEHIKFILATTEPQKLPETILSRCLQFHLQILSSETIKSQISRILFAENIKCEISALCLLAEAAAGSMRDALSLTEQAIAQGNGEVTLSSVKKMLRMLDKNQVLAVLTALFKKNGAEILILIEQLAEQAIDWNLLFIELLKLVHKIAILQFSSRDQITDISKIDEQLLRFANRISAKKIQFYYQHLAYGRKMLPYAPTPRIGIEAALLRMLALDIEEENNSDIMPKQPSENLEPASKFASYRETQTGPSILNNMMQNERAHIHKKADDNAELIMMLNTEVKKDTLLEKNLSPVMLKLSSDVNHDLITIEKANIVSPPAEKTNVPSSELNYVLSESLIASSQNAFYDLNVTNDQTNICSTTLQLLQAREQLLEQCAKQTNSLEAIKKVAMQKLSRTTKTDHNTLIKSTPISTIQDTVKLDILSSTADVTPFFDIKMLQTSLLATIKKELITLDEWAADIFSFMLPKLAEQLALNCFKKNSETDKICLCLRSNKQYLKTASAERALNESLNKQRDKKIMLTFSLDDETSYLTPNELQKNLYRKKISIANQSIKEDENIALICETFNAQIMTETIYPL